MTGWLMHPAEGVVFPQEALFFKHIEPEIVYNVESTNEKK
jgi:hypothetical protein